MREAYAALPERARELLDMHARRRKLFASGGRDAYVAAVLRADPSWRVRRHVTGALTRTPRAHAELAAARDADQRNVRRMRRLREAFSPLGKVVVPR